MPSCVRNATLSSCASVASCSASPLPAAVGERYEKVQGPRFAGERPGVMTCAPGGGRRHMCAADLQSARCLSPDVAGGCCGGTTFNCLKRSGVVHRRSRALMPDPEVGWRGGRGCTLPRLAQRRCWQCSRHSFCLPLSRDGRRGMTHCTGCTMTCNASCNCTANPEPTCAPCLEQSLANTLGTDANRAAISRDAAARGRLPLLGGTFEPTSAPISRDRASPIPVKAMPVVWAKPFRECPRNR